ncbi:MAG TPA: hypothetical protein VFV34_02925 [Blastocatellia bacterium]|nr:hypothetical protein [Blastocatellia bacterium]
MYPWVVWKSGQLARIAPHVTYLDEFTHFVGFDANESNLKARISFLQSMEFGSASWIDRLDDYAEVVVIWGDGWWEVYSTRESILKRLTNKFPSRPGDIHRAI